MKLSPKTLTGTLHNLNKYACDWGWQGQIAYGCQGFIVVVDPQSMQVLQCLDKHKGHVVKVKWARENFHHSTSRPYSLLLASADSNGLIVVWDVLQGSAKAELSDGNRPIADLDWLCHNDAGHDLLVALHPPYSFVLWNAVSGAKLWRKLYTETLRSFTFDPFNSNKLAFLGTDCILFIDDFSANKQPTHSGRKYFISSPAGVSQSSSSEKLSEKRSSRSLGKRTSNTLVGESSKRAQGEELVALNECLQLSYHRACRDHVLLVYSHEILILDLNINQTVGVIPMERSASPFAQVSPLEQRDGIMGLQDNGSVTLRVRRRSPKTACSSYNDDVSSPSHELGLMYDLRCQSDAMRITRNSRVFGMAVASSGEHQVALIMSDGRLLLWQVRSIKCQGRVSLKRLPVHPSTASRKTAAEENGLPRLFLDVDSTPPKNALRELVMRENGAENQNTLLRLQLIGLLKGIAAAPLVIRMCPPLNTKNWAQYQPLLAIGSHAGLVQVFNLSSGELCREISVHNCNVRGIEWLSQSSFLSFAFQSPGSTTVVRNEICRTDLQTGKTTVVRLSADDESPIETLKVSHLKQYFVVVFKEKPFELWDVHAGTLLKQMPKNFPQVTALGWSTSHSKSQRKKSLSESSSSGSVHGSDSGGHQASEPTNSRENFVFTDGNGLLYHFVVEGSVIRDESQIPPTDTGSMGSVTCIAWKGETLALGDVDGNVNLWDLKAKVFRTVQTHHGWIRKMHFAPGRGNMKLLLLSNDGVEVRDAVQANSVSFLKVSRDVCRVTDIDWAGSDKPVLAWLDGSVRVMDLQLKMCSSPVDARLLAEPTFVPALLPPKAALLLKAMLQAQPWCATYRLQLEESDSNSDICSPINEMLQVLDSDLQDYLPTCRFGTANRCLLTARLFGDELDINFWTVALHYLRMKKSRSTGEQSAECIRSTSSGDLFVPTPTTRESHDLVVFEEAINEPDTSWSFLCDEPLETCYDLLCDNHAFQNYHLEQASLHDAKRTTHAHTHACADQLLMLGRTERAVQLLLETEPDDVNHYTDSLRACLVASVRSSGASQSTIKLVATNLIASGKLAEGVQLLCLIDKGLDACRYLQAYGQWHKAAWLAKATLNDHESAEVIRRWADHLSSAQINERNSAVLVLLTLGEFVKVIEMLFEMRQIDKAARFIEACEEFALLDQTTDAIADLLESVFHEYARYMLQLGSCSAALYYCGRAGEKGVQLRQEIDKIFNN